MSDEKADPPGQGPDKGPDKRSGEEIVSLEDLVGDKAAAPATDPAGSVPNTSNTGSSAAPKAAPLTGAASGASSGVAAQAAGGADAKAPGRSSRIVAGVQVPEALQAADIDLARVDFLLELEDPAFARQLNELKNDKITDLPLEGVDIDDFIDEDKVDATAPLPILDPFGDGLRGLIRRVRYQIKSVISEIRGAFNSGAGSMRRGVIGTLVMIAKAIAFGILWVLKSVLAVAKQMLGGFWHYSFGIKAAFIGLLAMIVLLGALLGRRMATGRLMPDMTVRFLPTVAAQADATWTYNDQEALEDFASPYRLPEHVVLLDKIVVNIKPSASSDANPMGLFEFYVEASSQDVAIELSDRQSEVLDVVQRTIENITYDEIITAAGKNKLKLVIRKDINTILTKGRVRKVFYKTVVIKP